MLYTTRETSSAVQVAQSTLEVLRIQGAVSFYRQCWRRQRSTSTELEAIPAVTQKQDTMSQMVQKTASASQAPNPDGAVNISVMEKSLDFPLPESADDSVGATGAVHPRNDGYPSCSTEHKFPTVQTAQEAVSDHAERCRPSRRSRRLLRYHMCSSRMKWWMCLL